MPEFVFLVPITFMVCTAGTILGIMWMRGRHRELRGDPGQGREIAERLDRMEQGIDAIAVEMERVSEGQRFVTRLLSERSAAPALGGGERPGERSRGA
jgi:hypothetical protein